MKYNVIYSPSALRDLDRVWSEVFEASKDLSVTEKYIDDLLDKIEDRSLQPKSGAPLYYENSFTGYYYIIFKLYLAFYKIENNSLMVDRILFSKSDYLRILGF